MSSCKYKIRPQELRVGNWVMEKSDFNDRPDFTNYIQCDEDFLEVLFAARNYDDFLPIPLTKEILINSGFDYDGTYCSWCLLELYKQTYSDEIDLQIFGGQTIEYVHQLQNIFFAVFGGDVDIKFKNYQDDKI